MFGSTDWPGTKERPAPGELDPSEDVTSPAAGREWRRANPANATSPGAPPPGDVLVSIPPTLSRPCCDEVAARGGLLTRDPRDGWTDPASNTYALEMITRPWQSMTRIVGAYECAPGDRPQPELLHDATNALLVDLDAATLQLTRDTTIAVAWKVLVDAFDLLPQLVLLVATLSMQLVGFVVERAGGKACYFAGFSNLSKFFAVITDVSALLCR